MNYTRIVKTLLLSFISFFSHAQNINGDVLKVSKDKFPIIVFPGDVQDFTPDCNPENYRIKMMNKNSIKINPGSSERPGTCNLLIHEGDKNRIRTHRFIIK